MMIACSDPSDGQPGSSASALNPKQDAADLDAKDTNDANVVTTNIAYNSGSFQLALGGGTASVIGAGDASPWVIGTNHNVYHYSNDNTGARTWNPDNPSTFANSIAVSPEGTVWKIDGSGFVSSRSGPGTWVSKGTTKMVEIGVGRVSGTDNVVWGIGRDPACLNSHSADCTIYTWSNNTWVSHSGTARHVAVSPEGNVYVVNSSGTIYKLVNNIFQAWGSGCARNGTDTLGSPVIGAGPNDALWVIGCTSGTNGNLVYTWQPMSISWAQIGSASGNAITVSSDGTPWLVDSHSSNNIYEYVSSWQPMGPWGFQFVDDHGINQIWSGEVHDIDTTPSTGTITIGATAGGVFQSPPTFGWVPIGDHGVGITARPGPINSVGTITVKPSDKNTVIVGTGVAGSINGPNRNGNGIWVTHNANETQVNWGTGVPPNAALMYDQTGQLITTPPFPIVKLRYSGDSAKIYAITETALFLSTDDGQTFRQPPTGANCTPAGNHIFTDLVVDPNNSAIAYVGVAGEGVFQSTWTQAGGLACLHSAPPTFSGPTSSITTVALAIAALNSRLYVALAGMPNGFGSSGNDFQNIDSTTTLTWGQWTTTLKPDSPLLVCPPNTCNSQWGLGSQNNSGAYGQAHDWALGTDPSGTLIILGGIGLYRGTGCGANSCATFGQVDPEGGPHTTSHADYHAVSWQASTGWFYVANDGGLFYSQDGGNTWNNQTNSFNIQNEIAVAVTNNRIFAAGWDVAGHFSPDMGTTWLSQTAITGTDGRSVVADPGSSTYGYLCQGGGTNSRYAWDGTVWTGIDKAPLPLDPNNNNRPFDSCNMAKGMYGDLFTTGALIGPAQVFHSNDRGQSWSQFQTNLTNGPPWSLLASNEATPTLYAFSCTNNNCASSGTANSITTSIGNGGWNPPTRPPWPTNYMFAGTGPTAGAGAALDYLFYDLYVVGVQATDQTQALVYKSPAASHGTSWTALSGTVTPANGVPGRLKQDELVVTVEVDPSSHAVLVGTNSNAPPSAVYGAATLWRLNNADVLVDAQHHWRPWVNGFPNGNLPVTWLTGQFEGGVYYYYAATWGRGIWKREARGGDL